MEVSLSPWWCFVSPILGAAALFHIHLSTYTYRSHPQIWGLLKILLGPILIEEMFSVFIHVYLSNIIFTLSNLQNSLTSVDAVYCNRVDGIFCMSKIRRNF